MQMGGKNYDPANEVLPYQYEPELNDENANSSDENSSDSSDTSDGEGLDKVFKEKKMWRLESLRRPENRCLSIFRRKLASGRRRRFRKDTQALLLGCLSKMLAVDFSYFGQER
jgi:hypothetical protein